MSDFKYMTRDYEGLREDMIKLLKEKLPEYTDTTSLDPGIVLLEIFAHMLDTLSFYIDIVANESFLATAVERENVIQHTKTLGYTMSNATPAKFYLVFELYGVLDTDYIIPKGFRIKTKSSVNEESVYYEMDESLTITSGSLGNEMVEGEYIFKAYVTQGYTISGDYLGYGNDTENQEYVLNYNPVIEDSLEVFVGTGVYNPITGLPVYTKWTRVDNFIDSTPTSEHYTISVDENDNMSVLFGDGVAGLKPSREIMSSYRIGGGVVGNVGANTIVEMEQTLADISTVFNPEEAYVLGVDKESIEEAKIKAVSNIRTLFRAVTLADFEDLAIANLDVSKAKAIWDSVSSTVNIYLLPKVSATFTQPQKDSILAFYDERKLLGVNITVNDPVYIEVSPLIVVKVTTPYIGNTSSIRNELDNMLRNQYFNQGHYDFGQSFITSEIIAGFMSIQGVKSVYLEVEEDEELVPLIEVDVNENEIVVLSSSYSKDTSIIFG